MAEILSTQKAIDMHILDLSQNASPVALVEKQIYLKLLETEDLVSPNWNITQCGKSKVLYPSIYGTDIAPEIATYSEIVAEARLEAHENTAQMLNIVSKTWKQNLAIFNKAKSLALVTLPTVLLLSSPTQLQHTAEMIGVTKESLSDAFNETTYWKASEHVEFITPHSPHHDIIRYLASQNSDFITALVNHEKHEGAHPFIDHVSTQAGFGVHTWLTEGFCEWATGSRDVAGKNMRNLFTYFSETPSWKNLLSLTESTTADPQITKYSAGFVIVVAASYAFSNFTDFDSHMGAFLSLLVANSIEASTDLIHTLEMVCDSSNISDEELDKSVGVVCEKFI